MKLLSDFIINNMQTLVNLISVIIWPLLIVYLLYKFKNEVRGLINRISTVQLPGGTSVTMIEQQTELIQSEKVDIAGINAIAEELKATKDITKSLLDLQTRTTNERDTYILQFHFEKTYRLIFGSQLNILLAAESFPTIRQQFVDIMYDSTTWKLTYPKQGYIGFMVSSGFLQNNPTDSTYTIIDLGKLFLQYLRANNIQIQSKLPY